MEFNLKLWKLLILTHLVHTFLGRSSNMERNHLPRTELAIQHFDSQFDICRLTLDNHQTIMWLLENWLFKTQICRTKRSIRHGSFLENSGVPSCKMSLFYDFLRPLFKCNDRQRDLRIKEITKLSLFSRIFGQELGLNSDQQLQNISILALLGSIEKLFLLKYNFKL